MNEDDALIMAQRLVLAGNRIRIRKTKLGYFVETIGDFRQESRDLTRSIEKRLRRMENLLEKKATPRPDKVQSLEKIQGVVDGYLDKIQKMRGHRDISIASEAEVMHGEMKSVSKVLSEIISKEASGQAANDELEVDLYHRVAVLGKHLARRLKHD